MLNAEMKHRVVKSTIHEWVIGTEDTHSDAKSFDYCYGQMQKEMKVAGVDLNYDDAFHVRAGEGGEIIFYATVSRPKAELAEHFDTTATEAVEKLRALHHEADNEANKEDSWPKGHCNFDGGTWPCRTVRILNGED